MTHQRCTHCGRPIVLVPSAAARAERFGGAPRDYLQLFTIHARCQVDKWYKRDGVVKGVTKR